MKTVNLSGFLSKRKIKIALPLVTAILVLAACQNETESKEPPPPVSVTGVNLEDINLTIFATRDLKSAFEPSNATNKRGTWESSDPDVVSVSEDGIIRALKFTDETTYTGQATITVTTKDGGFTDSCVVTITMDAHEGILDLPPLKESFKGYFMIGNIFDPGNNFFPGDISTTEPYTITKPYLTRHYNILTPQNQMKPQYLCNATRDSYNEESIATAKRMIKAARAHGIKIQGHCLLWHDQIPQWQKDLRTSADTKEQVLGYLQEYVTYIVKEFKDCDIYAWDVLNEVFKDGVSATTNWKTSAMRDGSGGNPWYMKLGSDFVYEGFLAARLADPRIILYYNDYSLDNVGKATMVRNMVRDVNAKYAQDYPQANGRLLIEGIGMQSHHNASVSAAAIKASLDLFRPLGVKISISELDLLAQSWDDYNAQKAITTASLLKQAEMYGEYFKLFLDDNYAGIIERVTFWGVSDASSWRSRGKPLPFEGKSENWILIPESIKAKPAYYKIIEALELKKAE